MRWQVCVPRMSKRSSIKLKLKKWVSCESFNKTDTAPLALDFDNRVKSDLLRKCLAKVVCG